MITFSDLIDIVVVYSYESSTCNTYGHLYCDSCPRHYTWCFIDSTLLTLDYLYRGEYYG